MRWACFVVEDMDLHAYDNRVEDDDVRMTRTRDEKCSWLGIRHRYFIVSTLLCRVDRLDLICVERGSSCFVFDEDWNPRCIRFSDEGLVLLNLCSGSANRVDHLRPLQGGLCESRSEIDELIRMCIEETSLVIDQCRRALPPAVPFVCPRERCE